MPQEERLKLWQAIKEDLVRARKALPEAAKNTAAILQFQEFLDHNELELACRALGDYDQEKSKSAEFWLALRDAATKMGMPDLAEKYGRYAGAHGAEEGFL